MNKNKNILLDYKRRLSDRHMYSIVLCVIALVAAFGLYQYKRTLDYKSYIENQYNRAFHELNDYVSNIEASLAKSLLVNNPRQAVSLSADIWREAAFAQANLGQLPISHVQLDNTAKFLSQVGDYSYSLSRRSIDGDPITEDEFKELSSLHQYSKTLSDTLNKMEQEIYAGRIAFNEVEEKGNQFFAKASKANIGETMKNVENTFQEYPELIYDGPFSSHITKMEPLFLSEKDEISKDQAREKVAEFFGNDKNIDLKGESAGAIPAYNFSMKGSNKDETIDIEISKVGGKVVWMLKNRHVDEEKVSMEEAIKKAVAFLDSKGFTNMKESYFLKNNNVATINFAYEENDIVMYSDLIKVKVALDNGEIVGFESHGYLMAHHERELPEIAISKEEARAQINKNLNVEGVNLALIPLESKREVLCYEFKGKHDEREFLIYINVVTGKEEKILMLLETPDGTLTI